MVCLETSFLIDVLRGHEAAVDVVDAIDAEDVRPTVTPVVAAEVWVGAALGSSEERETAEALIESLTWLPFTRRAARRTGTIRAELARTGEPVGSTDAMIAAIAIEHDEELVTRDRDFERVPDLRTRTY